MKQDRVLILESEKYYFYDEGVYGDVFVNAPRSRCWKLFKVKESNSASHKSFQTEIKAYELAGDHPLVAQMVPKLFRSGYLNLQVLNKLGDEVSSEYISELNYEMEFLDLEFSKIGSIPSEDTQSIRNTFKEAGINCVSDASIAFNALGAPKLIDFGIREIEVWH